MRATRQDMVGKKHPRMTSGFKKKKHKSQLEADGTEIESFGQLFRLVSVGHSLE